MHLRANYILVSFSEYHPDKHYTWLPFPLAHCNPSLQNRKEKKRHRREEIEIEMGCKKERKKRDEFRSKKRVE